MFVPINAMENFMSDVSSTTVPGLQGSRGLDNKSYAKNPLMVGLFIAAAVVALLTLILMFVFVSNQSTVQEEARAKAIATRQAAEKEKTSTKGSIGPIEVIDTELYNRSNGAVGKSGSSNQPSIEDAEVDFSVVNLPGAGY
jgi:hypothetical protein